MRIFPDILSSQRIGYLFAIPAFVVIAVGYLLGPRTRLGHFGSAALLGAMAWVDFLIITGVLRRDLLFQRPFWTMFLASALLAPPIVVAAGLAFLWDGRGRRIAATGPISPA